MKYGEHNFPENFCNAVGIGDEAQAIGMLSSELAGLIHSQPDTVKALLEIAGVKVNGPQTQAQLASLLTHNLDNIGVQKSLAHLFELAHSNKIGSRMFSADGGGDSSGGIRGAIGGLIDKYTGAKDQTKAKTLESLNDQNPAPAKKMYSPWKIGGIVLLTGLGIAGIVYLVKHFSKDSKPSAPAVA